MGEPVKFPRRLLDKAVEVHWKDPATIQAEDAAKLLRGRKGLGTWRTYGIAESVTDGVVRIVHNAGCSPDDSDPDTFDATNVPESLIEAVWGFGIRVRVQR